MITVISYPANTLNQSFTTSDTLDSAEIVKNLFVNVAEAIDAGANGVAIGRNIWQHPHPASVCRALVAIVHGGANVAQALKEISD